MTASELDAKEKMCVNIKKIETVLLLIVAIRINAQTPAPVKKDDMALWYPNKAMDVWSGKKTMINVITNDFFGVLNGVALNPRTYFIILHIFILNAKFLLLRIEFHLFCT